ncbi:MAG TPA: hypothetical protein VFC40_00970 [Syntrophomonas sp.]|nr:hypothetical protein [Syntrophomonas sp.]
MNFIEPNTQSEGLELSEFMLQIKAELELQGQELQSAQLNQDELENYVLDLNSYYYQSFHERFFPLYRAQLEADMKRLYKIAREESALKEDIIKNLKRVAQMYNHVKNGLNVLKQNRALVDHLRLRSNRSQDQSSLSLIYALKDLQTSLIGCLELLNDFQTLLDDQTLIKSLQIYPFQSGLKALWLIWDPENNSFSRDFKRLMINLELSLKLVLKLPKSDDKFPEDRDNILDELDKIENNLTTKKYSPALANWFKQHIRPPFLIYLELLNLNIKQRDRKRIQQTANNFENWLQALLYLLGELSRRSGKPQPLLLELHFLDPGDPSRLKELLTLCTQTEKSIKELIQQYAEADNPSYSVFSDAASKILSGVLPQFKVIQEHKQMTDYSLVNNAIERLNSQVSFLEMQIDQLDSREEHAVKLKQQYERMLETIDSYQDLLGNMKNQLSRTLAPRNISRQFKELDLRVEHIPISQGEVFPSAYLYLLGVAVANRDSDQDCFVQEEDGDIFLFRLDELQDELIPKIVLTGKG